MKKIILILLIAASQLLSQGTLYAQSISITQISPSTSADLTHQEEVTIHFDYSIDESKGAQIFIRPITSGNLTPNYAASGSEVYRGSGSSTANFTITSGNVTVDQLRVRVISSNQRHMLFEFFVPVDLTFSGSDLRLPTRKNNQIPMRVMPDLQERVPFPTRIDSIPADAEIVKRSIKPDGTVEIHYTGGFVQGHMPKGGEYIVSPAGDTTWTATLPMINVQDADQPVPPLGIAESAGSESQRALLRELDEWMTEHSDRLITTINQLVTDEEAFQNYKAYEKKTCDSIYDRINLRYTVLEKLMQGDAF